MENHCDEVATEYPETRVQTARRDLLDRIGAFVMRHDLDVNGPNLATICAALSGSSRVMAQTFATREISGEPIDQRWLDTVVRLDPQTGERMDELERLMDQLEFSLMRFTQTARTAHVETSEHRGTIDAQIVAMEENAAMVEAAQSGGASIDGADNVARIIGLSRAMVERVELIEAAMARSQAESEHLRESLAKARLEADVDHLTGLPNRRAFERTLISSVQRAQDRGEHLCVGFCDIDRFKSINDRHGHDAGDRVLVSIADTLSLHASDECFVARHGGEEFVLLFFGSDKDTAVRKLEAIRRAQASKLLVNRETGKGFGKITFSGGIAEVEGPHDARDALSRADKALYDAKSAGRNRVVAI